MTYIASPCPCGYPSCKDWHVSSVAAVQGVSFTREQATAVAHFLNNTVTWEDGWGFRHTSHILAAGPNWKVVLHNEEPRLVKAREEV